MKYIYNSVTGEKFEVNVSVSKEIEAYLEESERLEDNYARNQRRHNFSSDACLYESLAYSDLVTPESII